jgi:hypothetical protein
MYLLVIKLLQKKSEHFLVTDYLRKTPLENFAKKESLFKLLQVLAFVRTEKIQPQKEKFLAGQTYFAFKFPLLYMSTYGLLVWMPLEVRDKPVAKKSKKGKCLMVEIYIAKLLYNYQYPFVLPTSFIRYKNIYDLHVKIEILRAFCSRDIKKQINLVTINL